MLFHDKYDAFIVNFRRMQVVVKHKNHAFICTILCALIGLIIVICFRFLFVCLFVFRFNFFIFVCVFNSMCFTLDISVGTTSYSLFSLYKTIGNYKNPLN